MKAEISHPWEGKLQAAASSFVYPATPDVRRAVRQRLAGRDYPRAARRLRLAWAALIGMFILAGLLAVPGVRAQIAEFIQIGVVRIFPAAPTPTPTHLPPTESLLINPTAQPSPISQPVTALPERLIPSPTAFPSPTTGPLPALLDLAGETTLEKARQEVEFLIRLPGYPPDLGQPDRVYLQTSDGQMLVLAWTDPAQSNRMRLSLQMITPGSIFIEKFQPKVIQETSVNGQRAVWAEGPYMLQLRNGNYNLRQLVGGNTLIWVEDTITYRLETGQSLDEAVKIAESLK